MNAPTEYNRRMRRAFARRYGVDARSFGRPMARAIPGTPGREVAPETPEQFEEFLHDYTAVNKALADGSFSGRLKQYVGASQKASPEILAQVKADTERTMVEWLKEQGETHARPALDPTASAQRGNRSGRYNPQAPAAALDKEYKSTSDFLRVAWDKVGSIDPEVTARIMRIRAEYSSISPADGGFLVPERLRAELLRVAVEASIVRSRARIVPMDSATVPFPVIDSTSNASSIHGGIVGYWTAEGKSMTASSAKFARVVLQAAKLTAYSEIPIELLQDSIISLAAFVEEVFPEAIAWFEDVAFLTGNGVDQPLGVLDGGNSALVTVSGRAGQPADTIVVENLADMFSRMLPTSLNRCVWLVPPDAFPELATMALSVGTGGGPVWITNIAGGPPMTIYGRPVVVTEKVPALGAAGGKDVALVDFGYYLIGDRMQLRVESSTEYKFGSGEVAYRVIERVDGRPWMQSAVTPKNGSANTLSPYVVLGERS